MYSYATIFEKRVLRRIFGPKTDKVTEECSKRQSEKLNNRHSSTNIIRVIKSRRMRWAGHAACMGRGQVYTGFWEDKVKMDLQEVGLVAWTGFIWLRIGTGDEHLYS